MQQALHSISQEVKGIRAKTDCTTYAICSDYVSVLSVDDGRDSGIVGALCMKRTLSALLALVAGATFLTFNINRQPATPPLAATPTIKVAAQAPITVSAIRDETLDLSKTRADVRWQEPVAEPALEAFRGWTHRYVAAPKENRSPLESEGIALAKTRREKMMTLITTAPQVAVDSAVPVTIWRQMPVSIRAQLETRVDAKGDVLVEARTPLLGSKGEGNVLTLVLGNEKHRAYGEERTTTRFGIPVSGISLSHAETPGKKIVAISKEAGRVLEPVEVAAAKDALGADPVCITSGKPSGDDGDEVALSIGGSTNFYCGKSHAQAAMSDATQAALTFAGGRAYQSTGSRKILIYRVDFSDYQGQRVSQATLETLINDLQTMWNEMSYGAFTWVAPGTSGSQVTPVLRLPLTADNYTSLGTFLDACRVAAKAQGYDYTKFDFDMVVTAAKPTASFGGVGYVGFRGCWLANSQWNFGVASHELGHNVGLLHANYWDSPSSDPIDSAGTSVEYGDGIDIMGGANSDFRCHYNAREKNLLNWVPNASVIQAGPSGTYRIYAMDKRASGTSNLARAVRIDRLNSANDWWIDYRQLYAASNANAKNGIWLRWGQTGNTQTNLIDMVPGGTKDDAPLQIGSTFTDSSDPANPIYITPIARGNVDPDWVDVRIVQGAGLNKQPTVTMSATNTVPNPNVNTTITATADDPDGDPLTYVWDMGDGSSVTNNAPTITYKYPTTGNRTVRCTVSDGRGGTATGSIIIKVGGQTLFTIAGAVKNVSGNPMQGVTVSAGGTRTDVTDTSGNYTITNLPTGNYTLTATKTGLTINLATGTTNPIAVGPLPVGDKLSTNFTVAPGVPSLGVMQSAIVDAGSNTGDITIPLSDPDSPLDTITLTGTSSNTTLIPNANIAFGIRGTARTCRVTAAANKTGNVTITITARDPQNNQTTTTWPVIINNNPTMNAGTFSTPQDMPVDINLRLLANDDLAANTALAFEVSRVIGGTAEVLPDGFTARFTPMTGYQGPANFRVTARDQSLSSRLVLLYDFEPPDVTTDGKTSDRSNYHADGTLNLVGTSEYNYQPETPTPLKPFSTKSLSFSDNGSDSAARLLRVMSVNDLDFSNNSTGWSFSTWVNRRSNTSDDFIFHLGAGDGYGPDDELQLYFPAGENRVVLAKYGAAGLASGFTANNVGVNEWHHVAFTCTIATPGQGSFALYLDGFLVGTTPPTPLAFDQSAPLAFGGHSATGTPGLWLDGYLDDVSLYSNVLPHADVAGLAKLGTRHYLGQATNATITVNITGANDAPIIQPIANRRVPSGSATDIVGVEISDAETPARDLIVTATSSNPALVPNANLTLSPTAPWISTDIGAVGAAGSTTESAGTLIVRGSGAQIETNQDEFRLVHLPMSGDGEVITRVVSMDYTHELGRSGIMFRSGPTDNAMFAFVGVGPGSSAVFQARSITGATTATIGEVSRLPMPRWLRLVRTGNTITAFHATDNAGNRGAWQSLGSTTINLLPNSVYAGLAVNSHVDATLATTLFDHVSGDIANGAKRRLTIQPVSGVPGTTTITVTVSDGLLSSNTTFDFSTNTAPGISAIADRGLEQGTTSEPIPFTISDDETAASAITLSGASNNQNLIANADITFGGSDENRTVTLHAKPGVKGLAEITLVANDGQLTTSRKFRVFVAPAGTMVVNVNGFGALSGYFGETTQTPGKEITISGKAVGGQAFVGWRGLITSYAPKITFTMPAVMYLEAIFEASPYPRQVGTWNGLILDDPRTHEHAGNILFTITTAGAYTGKLTYAGKVWPFRGILHTDGTAADATIARADLSDLQLHFEWDGVKHSLSGEITDGTVVSTFVAHHSLFTTSRSPKGAQRPIPSAWLGKVTANFTADPIAGPNGTGFATGSVAGSGAVKLAGKLADGSPFTTSAFLSIGGDCPFYIPLYKGLGSATGWMLWRDLPGSDFTGSVTTFRPADPESDTFSTGWPDGATLTATGSYYIAPKAARSPTPGVLPFPDLLPDDENGNATLTLDGAGFLNAAYEAHLSALGKLTLGTAAESVDLSLALNPANGLLTGAATLGDKSIKLCGAILQKANVGAGFSLTPGATGGLTLTIAE